MHVPVKRRYLTHLKTVRSLSFDQYEGEVFRTEEMKSAYQHQRDDDGNVDVFRVGEEIVRLTDEEKEQEKEIAEKLAEFAKARERRAYVEYFL